MQYENESEVAVSKNETGSRDVTYRNLDRAENNMSDGKRKEFTWITSAVSLLTSDKSQTVLGFRAETTV